MNDLDSAITHVGRDCCDVIYLVLLSLVSRSRLLTQRSLVCMRRRVCFVYHHLEGGEDVLLIQIGELAAQAVPSARACIGRKAAVEDDFHSYKMDSGVPRSVREGG